MLITYALQSFVPSMLSVGSWACAQCGSRMSAREEDGTLLFSCENDSPPPSLSRFKHVAVLTRDGNLSILCASSRSDVDASDPTSGAAVGIFSSLANSERHIPFVHGSWSKSDLQRQRERVIDLGIFFFTRFNWRSQDGAQYCGCDPKENYLCEQHAPDFLAWLEVRN